ncbi:terminase large subunit domain-containing protein [Paenarthrobacter nitroguajacolicus]|uniref:terminase large subunit domain-containing protein n=1 Tax=Paenarthrobacter nitroguajacolicus TaxID=211146 RepID=UPI0015BBAD81|nr:terminase large subunit [Paenarthrobacter nitroguajacolicus]NWL32969.1 terminase [Paenarthrobacter nitroguajacolicus]
MSQTSKLAPGHAAPVSGPNAVDPGDYYRSVCHVAEPDQSGAKRKKIFGYAEPRICTPPLRALTPETTLGYDVIDFARDVLGLDLYPWQKVLLCRMLELLPDGSLRFRTAVVLIARQNGKSTLSQVLALWFMIVWGWPLVMGTAQDLETAEEVWQGAVDLVEEDEELSKLLKRVVKVNGKKALELKAGSRYKVKAANRRAGRGFTGNLIMLDELREHQNWEAWGAITKTTMAQAEALILALSNAGDLTSIVLRYLRKMAHEALGDPDGICEEIGAAGPSALDVADLTEDDEELDDDELADFEQDEDTLGLWEWSMAPGTDKRDRQGWAQANPSLNWNPGFTERTIAAACKTDPEWVFRTEVGCQWSEGTLTGPFPPGAWDKGKNPVQTLEDGTIGVAEEHRIIPGSEVWAGVDQSHDRSMTYVAFGGFRADGKAQVEIVAARHGSDWVKGYLMDDKRRGRVKAVAGQSKGAPISPLMESLAADIEFTIPVVEWSGSDLTNGWADVFDSVRDVTVFHNPQPVLDTAAATAVVKVFSGGASIPDHRASPAEVAPLMAFTAVKWLMGRREVTPPPAAPPPEALQSTDTDYASDDVARMGF